MRGNRFNAHAFFSRWRSKTSYSPITSVILFKPQEPLDFSNETRTLSLAHWLVVKKGKIWHENKKKKTWFHSTTHDHIWTSTEPTSHWPQVVILNTNTWVTNVTAIYSYDDRTYLHGVISIREITPAICWGFKHLFSMYTGKWFNEVWLSWLKDSGCVNEVR